MERTQKLILDFTETGSREEYLTAYSGDMRGEVVEIEVNPALNEGEVLICSFIKDGAAVDTLAIPDGRLVIPYTVLKEPGRYTAVFAVADMSSRLTSATQLTVNVEEDRLSVAPAEDMGEDQTLVSYILAAAAAVTRQALDKAESNSEDIDGLTDAVDGLREDLDSAQTDISGLTSQLSGVSSDVAALENTVAVLQAVSGSSLVSGSGCITGSSTANACVEPNSWWIRIGNFVLVSFAFGSYGSTLFGLDELPFASAEAIFSTTLRHIAYSANGVNFYRDCNVDLCQTERNGKSLTVLRDSTSAAVLSGTLVYITNDPMPAEVTA